MLTLKNLTFMLMMSFIFSVIGFIMLSAGLVAVILLAGWIAAKYMSAVKVERKKETVEETPGMTVDANGLADMKMLAWYKDLKFVLTHTNCNNDLMYCSASIAEFEAAFMYMPGAKDLLNELINTYDAIKNKVVE